MSSVRLTEFFIEAKRTIDLSTIDSVDEKLKLLAIVNNLKFFSIFDVE